MSNNLDRMFAELNSPKAFAESYADYVASIIRELNFDLIAEFIEIILAARQEGKKIFFIGNGGSASTASHFANDLSIGTRCPERPFKAVSLTDNVAVLTAIANDDGYDHLFVKQLEILMEPGDIVVAISASGNSPNVVNALQLANIRGNHTVALTGFESGGKIAELAKTVIHVKTRNGEYGPVEDVHLFIDHLIGSFLNRIVLAERGAGRWR